MAVDVTLQAGAQLRALYGHIICVGGQDLQLGPDGLMQAPPAAAAVLLRQAGWTEKKADAAGDAEDAGEQPQARRRARAGA